MDHVERLSRGKRSGSNIGSRSVGHYLKPHERTCYERALKKGYLDITDKNRANLWHIWEKACLAKKWNFIVLLKNTTQGTASIYNNNEKISNQDIHGAKKEIKELALLNVNISAP